MRNLLNEKGFTLIEMLIVLLIISILIIITIPNVTKHSATINEKGCEAFIKMVQGQVEAYQIEHKTIPTLQDLTTNEYLTADQQACPNGQQMEIDATGKVTVVGSTP